MKRMFTSDKFFGAVTALAIICTAIFADIFFTSTPELWLRIVVRLVTAACLAVLFISYKTHSKNVMKGMMGALLMQMFTMYLMSLEVFFATFDRVMMIAATVISAALFITHFVINSTHKSSSAAIRVNQVLCILYSAVMIADAVFFVTVDETIPEKLGDILSAIASVCVSCAIVCVESRLDAYRLDREAAGWTEEKGYPEGYVHQKDR